MATVDTSHKRMSHCLNYPFKPQHTKNRTCKRPLARSVLGVFMRYYDSRPACYAGIRHRHDTSLPK